MQECCEFCNFSASVLALFACRPRHARAMEIVLYGAWFGGESRSPHPGTCTCRELQEEWDRYMDLLLDSQDVDSDRYHCDDPFGEYDDISEDSTSSS